MTFIRNTIELTAFANDTLETIYPEIRIADYNGLSVFSSDITPFAVIEGALFTHIYWLVVDSGSTNEYGGKDVYIFTSSVYTANNYLPTGCIIANIFELVHYDFIDFEPTRLLCKTMNIDQIRTLQSAFDSYCQPRKFTKEVISEYIYFLFEICRV